MFEIPREIIDAVSTLIDEVNAERNPITIDRVVSQALIEPLVERLEHLEE